MEGHIGLFLTALLTLLNHVTDTTPLSGGRVYIVEGNHYLVIKRSFPEITEHLDKIDNSIDELRKVKQKNRMSEGVNRLLSKCIEGVTWKSKLLKDRYGEVAIRGKRGIELLGELWSTLSGNPSPSEWKTSQKIMEEINTKLKTSDQQFVTFEETIKENTNRLITLEHDHHMEIQNLSRRTNLIGTELDHGIAINTACIGMKNNMDIVNEEIRQMKEMATSSTLGVLARQAIDVEKLKEIVSEIGTDRGLSPLVEESNIDLMYTERFTTTTYDGATFTSVVNLPLIDKQRQLHIGTSSYNNMSLIEEENQRYHFYADNKKMDKCIKLSGMKGMVCKIRMAEIYGSPSDEKLLVEVQENKFQIKGFAGDYDSQCDRWNHQVHLNGSVNLWLPSDCSLIGSDLFVKKAPTKGDRTILKVEYLEHLSNQEDALDSLSESTPSTSSEEDDEWEEKEKEYQRRMDEHVKEIEKLHKKQDLHTEIIKDLTKTSSLHPAVYGGIGLSTMALIIVVAAASFAVYKLMKHKEMVMNFNGRTIQ